MIGDYDKVRECYHCDGFNTKNFCDVYTPFDNDYCAWKKTIDGDLEKLKRIKQGSKEVMTFPILEDIIQE